MQFSPFRSNISLKKKAQKAMVLGVNTEKCGTPKIFDKNNISFDNPDRRITKNSSISPLRKHSKFMTPTAAIS